MIADYTLAEGERRKADVLGTLAAHREVYVNRGRRALLMQCLASGFASADDVRRVVKLPPGVDPKLFGAVPGALARAGIIRRADYRKTRRAKAHARPVTLWELIDTEGARLWLAEHPESSRHETEQKQSPTAGTAGLFE